MGGFCEMPDEDFQDVIMPGIESAVLDGCLAVTHDV